MVHNSVSPEYYPIPVIADRRKNYQNNKVQNKPLEILTKHESTMLQNLGLRKVQYVCKETFREKVQKKPNPSIKEKKAVRNTLNEHMGECATEVGQMPKKITVQFFIILMQWKSSFKWNLFQNLR